MANYGYVIPKKMPAAKQINKDVVEFVAKRFPQFTVEFNETNWLISHKYDSDKSVGLTFHIDKYRRKKCIAFRHLHGWDFLYWIEDEIQCELAKKYDATLHDDAFEEEFKLTSFATFKEYFDHKSKPNCDKKWLKEREKYWNVIGSFAPDSLKDLIK